jgi:DNA polymerase
MFRVPVEKHGVNGHLRQKGKIAELALGYGGGVGALKAMGAIEMGLHEEELQPLVDAWRAANPHITRFWWDVDSMVRTAINSPGTIQRLDLWKTRLIAQRSRYVLNIGLPSGRCLRYFKPELGVNKFGSESITYEGTDAGKWTRLESYGPKLTENIVQAVARDCLRDAMYWVSKKLPDITMHIHDEMVVEVDEDKAEEALRFMQTIMAVEPVWAPGLLLRGDGYITKYYRKD